MSDFIQDNLDVIDALAFFGISENNISDALDIKAIERMNMKHQFGDSNTKAKSNSYFAIIKNKQHIIEKIVRDLDGQVAQVGEKNHNNNTYQQSQPSYEQPKTAARDTIELAEFKRRLAQSLRNMEVDQDGKIAKKEINEQPSRPTYQSTPQQPETRRPLYGQQNNNYNRQNSYSGSSYDGQGADGVCKAGSILSIIGASFNIIWALIMLAIFPVAGLIIGGLAIWTIVANSKVLSGTADDKTGAGVLGLLFGWFLGGILTLAGRYRRNR